MTGGGGGGGGAGGCGGAGGGGGGGAGARVAVFSRRVSSCIDLHRLRRLLVVTAGPGAPVPQGRPDRRHSGTPGPQTKAAARVAMAAQEVLAAVAAEGPAVSVSASCTKAPLRRSIRRRLQTLCRGSQGRRVPERHRALMTVSTDSRGSNTSVPKSGFPWRRARLIVRGAGVVVGGLGVCKCPLPEAGTRSFSGQASMPPMSGHGPSDVEPRRLRYRDRQLPMSTHEGSDIGNGTFRCEVTKLPISTDVGSDIGIGAFRCEATKLPISTEEGSDIGIGGFRCPGTSLPISTYEGSDIGIGGFRCPATSLPKST